MKRLAILFGLCASSAAAEDVAVGSGDPLVLRSPNGKVVVRVTLEPKTEPTEVAGPTASWSLDFEGTPLLAGCALGLVDEWVGELLGDFKVRSTIERRHDEPVPILFGKAASAHGRIEEVFVARFRPRPRGREGR